MNKKGAELSMNVIIITILVVLVLVIVASFFMFGMAGLADKIREFFGMSIAGTDLVAAKQSCDTYCAQAQMLADDSLESKSAYCVHEFKIDLDGDGEADKEDDEYVDYYCWDDDLSITCADVTC